MLDMPEDASEIEGKKGSYCLIHDEIELEELPPGRS
jgi:hypothetical protein